MSTGINNVKLHTINIYAAKMIFLFASFIIFSSSTPLYKNDKGWIIVIDPGHGGKDPGALGSFSQEKNIALAIALKTGEYIEQNIKNVTVIYTRKTDTFVELRDRPEIANKCKADLFISIHVNAALAKNAYGTETYFMGLAKNQRNLDVAMKENEVILLEKDHSTKYEGFDPKSPESYIMFSLTQYIYREQCKDLATKIQTQYKGNKREDREVQQAGFLVLYMTSMPSVLTETGFITNTDEEKYLNSKDGQDKISSSIFKACNDYINEIDSKSGISISENQSSDTVSDSTTYEISQAGDLMFRVQVTTSATKTEINPENFKGIKDIDELFVLDRYKYVTGSFTDYSAAAKYRKTIEKIYPDAFVIAIKDNKIVPLQEAIEKKKKNKSKF